MYKAIDKKFFTSSYLSKKFGRWFKHIYLIQFTLYIHIHIFKVQDLKVSLKLILKVNLKLILKVSLKLIEIWPLGCFFQNFEPFLSFFLPWLWMVGSGDSAG